MADIPENLKPALAELLLSIADDKLMLGTRDSDWTGLGPILDEGTVGSFGGVGGPQLAI